MSTASPLQVLDLSSNRLGTRDMLILVRELGGYSSSNGAGANSGGLSNGVLQVLDLGSNLAELGETEVSELAAALGNNRALRELRLRGNRIDTKAQMFVHGWLKLKGRGRLVQLQ